VKHTPLVELVDSARRARIMYSLLLGAALGCAGVKPTAHTGSGGSSSGNGGSSGGGGSGGTGVIVPELCNGKCTDFPTDPIVDSSLPGNPQGMFGSPSGSGPCVTEPEDGTLFPNNWLRPRVHVNDGAGTYKITFSSDKEANDLVAYTAKDSWTLPKDIWVNLARHVISQDITVTVQKAGGGATTSKFQIAPVGATGNLVFWAANPALVGAMPSQCYADVSLCSNASELRGFSIGDESTVSVLAIAQVKQPSRKDSGDPAPVVCIGCHSGTPDDSFVSLDDHYPWRAALASVGMGTSGTAYSTVTPAGLAALQQPGWGPISWTKSNGSMDFWQTGKKIGVGSLGLKDPTMPDPSNGPDQNDSPHLAWINVEATTPHVKQNADWNNWAYPSYTPGAGIDSGNSLGFLKHDGDAGGAAMPNWSHDGTTIVYSSTNASISGRLNQEVATPTSSTNPALNGTTQTTNAARKPGMTDLYTVLFNGGLGGTAKPVSGAATTQFEEYYAAYSPDDKFIAYTRAPAGEVMFANPNAEIAIVPAAGGDAQVLAANKPPACTGKTSPGVNNHWPKWSPEVQHAGAVIYYWLIFSSIRAGLPPVKGMGNDGLHQISQLYMAPVVLGETGFISYPAIYLWNQPTDRVNTTPAWATFEIPPVP
jgi:hypothetical protein